MMAKKFKNIFKKKNFKKDHKNSKKEEKKKEIIWYKCKYPGHMKFDCTELKDKKKYKGKAMKATLDD